MAKKLLGTQRRRWKSRHVDSSDLLPISFFGGQVGGQTSALSAVRESTCTVHLQVAIAADPSWVATVELSAGSQVRVGLQLPVPPALPVPWPCHSRLPSGWAAASTMLLLLLLLPPLVCAQRAGGPGNYSCGVVPRSAFHFTDPGGCAINDPNAPFFDAEHGIYHLFYQNHVWLPVNKSDCTSGGPGPTWGHAISRDMVIWDPLPPALWNSDWYDRCAVYTGSATILPDGSPAIMYPGICEQDDDSHNCTTGTNLNVAFPTDRSVPNLMPPSPSEPAVHLQLTVRHRVCACHWQCRPDAYQLD